MIISKEEIEKGKSKKGGWTKETLAQWGVPWPPPKGWKQSLINGEPLAEQEFATGAIRDRSRGSDTAKLLQKVVALMIERGHGDLLKEIDELMEYYGSTLPTVADVIGGRPSHAVISGGISFDDKVYRFTCARMTK